MCIDYINFVLFTLTTYSTVFCANLCLCPGLYLQNDSHTLAYLLFIASNVTHFDFLSHIVGLLICALIYA